MSIARVTFRRFRQVPPLSAGPEADVKTSSELEVKEMGQIWAVWPNEEIFRFGSPPLQAAGNE
jgi:hypothetical protein